jgi:ATP-dependent helicase/nuclease subunit B
MLEFLLGTDEYAKINTIFDRAAADAQSGKTVFILVPEQYSMIAEQELILRLGLSSQNKIQILTFSRLVNLIFSKLGPLRTKYIDKAGKYLIACRSMQICQKNLRFFSRNISQPGFASLVVSLISEFKRYGIKPQDLQASSEGCKDTVLSLKLLDLALIYQKFDQLVLENWINAEDNLAIALPKISSADFLSGQLYISFFQTFTPVEYEVIASLINKMDITISLCTNSLDENSDIFSSQVITHKRLCSIASQLGIAIKKPEFFNDKRSGLIAPEILHLKQNYFLPKPVPFDKKPECIHLLRPKNLYSEVEDAARLIMRLCRTKGYRFSDFLILSGSIEDYELILPSVFDEFGISYFLDQKLRFAENPLMQMIISVLEILAFGFSYERIMTILRSGFWNITRSEADIFENYILAADINHKQWNSCENWTYNPDVSAFDMAEINRIKERTINKIHELLLLFKGRKTIGDICRHFTTWLNSISLTETVSDKIKKLDTDPQSADRLRQVWSTFISVLNQIFDCMGDTPATFADFYELFCTCCNELSIAIIPPSQDNVTITTTDRFSCMGSKIVIVLGVLDKSFPKSFNDEGILSDAERIKLRESGLSLAPDLYSQQKDEQFIVYSVFGTAQHQLYLSSPSSDQEGKSLGSSQVFKRIKSLIFPKIEIESDMSEISLIEGKPHTFSELCAHLFKCHFDASRLSSVWKAVYNFFINNDEYKKKLEDYEQMYRLEAEPPAISKAMAKSLYGSSLSLSVSKLEKYNSCAFSFFMKYGLLADERLLGGLKVTDTGSILHEILCKYFKDKSVKNTDYNKIERSTCFDEISSLVDSYAKECDHLVFAFSNYYSYMLMRLKNIAAATAWKLVRFYAQSKFRPSGFEVSFGRHGDLPSYDISTQIGRVSLNGFIDKVDSAIINGQNYIAITDYKSSEKHLDLAMIDAGITLQPLIYANAVAKGTGDAKPAAMMYLQMNDPVLKFDTTPTDAEWEASLSSNIKAHGLFLDEPDVLAALDPDPDNKNSIHYINCDKKSRLVSEIFEKRLTNAEKCAGETAEKIFDGLIDANPPRISGFDPCEYCPYGSICQKD